MRYHTHNGFFFYKKKIVSIDFIGITPVSVWFGKRKKSRKFVKFKKMEIQEFVLEIFCPVLCMYESLRRLQDVVFDQT